MAERRMLHRKASVSTDLTELRRRHGSDAALFYVLMIPHFDRWGCVPDNVITLKAMVCPTWDDVTFADVKRWVAWMVKRGMLVRVVGLAGDQGLRSPDFHDHQRGTEFQKESPSPFEPAEITERWVRDGRKPKVAELQGGRRPVADQSPPRSVRREGKGREVNPSPSLTTDKSAAATPEPSPGAQAPPAGEESTPKGSGSVPVKENGRVDLEAFAEDAPPIVAEAILRARRRIAQEEAE